jgi:hypothetical protein
MPNDYLIHCHQHISHELDQAEKLRRQAQARGDARQVAFHTGRMEELSSLRAFLSEHFNLTTQQYF